MEKKTFNTTKFEIDSKIFEESLNPSNKKFKIHLATASAVEDMKKRIGIRENKNSGAVNLDASHSESTIRKSINDGFISQSVFHALLCLLFNELSDDKYTQPYSQQSVKDFLSSLTLIYNEPGSIKKFNDFFAILEIPEKFGLFEVTIDEKWNFTTSEIEEINEKNLLDLEKQKELKQNNSNIDAQERDIDITKNKPLDSSNNIEKKILKKKEGFQILPSKQFKLRRISKKWAYIIIGFFILCTSYFIFDNLKKVKIVKNSKEIQISENCKCIHPKKEHTNAFQEDIYKTSNKRLQAVIYEFKEYPTIDNSGLANKIFKRLSNIIKRDSLSIDLKFCKQFNHFNNIEEVKSDHLYRYKLSETNCKSNVQVMYLNPKKDKKKIKENKLKTAFEIPAGKVFAQQQYSEQYINSMTYLSLLHLIKKSREFYTNTKAIDYIDKILINDNTSHKTKIMLLHKRAYFVNKSNFKNINEIMISEYKSILKIDSSDRNAMRYLSKFQLKNRDPKAIETLNLLIDSRPSYIMNVCHEVSSLAEAIALFKADYEKALTVLDTKSKKICEQSYAFMEKKAFLKLLNQEYEEAYKLFQECNRINYNEMNMLHSNYALYKKGEYEQAVKNLENMKGQENISHYNYFYITLMHYHKGNMKLALKAYKKSQIGKSSMISTMYMKSNQFLKAKNAINQALRGNTINPVLYNIRRKIEHRLGNLELAKLDSLKIIDELDIDFFRLKKDTLADLDFHFLKVFKYISLPN